MWVYLALLFYGKIRLYCHYRVYDCSTMYLGTILFKTRPISRFYISDILQYWKWLKVLTCLHHNVPNVCISCETLFFFDVWNSNNDTIIAMVQFWFNPATGEGEQNYCASRSIARANCHLFSSRYLLKSSSVRAPAPQSLSEKLTGMFFAVSLFSHSSECGFIDFLLPHASRLRFQSLPWEWTS